MVRLLDISSYRSIFERNGTDEITEGGEVIEKLIRQLPSVDQWEHLVDEIEARAKADMNAIKTILAKIPEEEDISQRDSKLDELKTLLTGELKGKKNCCHFML